MSGPRRLHGAGNTVGAFRGRSERATKTPWASPGGEAQAHIAGIADQQDPVGDALRGGSQQVDRSDPVGVDGLFAGQGARSPVRRDMPEWARAPHTAGWRDEADDPGNRPTSIGAPFVGSSRSGRPAAVARPRESCRRLAAPHAGTRHTAGCGCFPSPRFCEQPSACTRRQPLQAFYVQQSWGDPAGVRAGRGTRCLVGAESRLPTRAGRPTTPAVRSVHKTWPAAAWPAYRCRYPSLAGTGHSVDRNLDRRRST